MKMIAGIMKISVQAMNRSMLTCWTCSLSISLRMNWSESGPITCGYRKSGVTCSRPLPCLINFITFDTYIQNIFGIVTSIKEILTLRTFLVQLQAWRRYLHLEHFWYSYKHGGDTYIQNIFGIVTSMEKGKQKHWNYSHWSSLRNIHSILDNLTLLMLKLCMKYVIDESYNLACLSKFYPLHIYKLKRRNSQFNVIFFLCTYLSIKTSYQSKYLCIYPWIHILAKIIKGMEIKI